MTTLGEFRAKAIGIALSVAALAAVAGCAGGGMPDLPSMPAMPDLPSMPAFAALSADPATEKPAEEAKPKAEQKSVNIAELMQPGTLGDRSMGKANAPVTIIQYVSLSCPNCAKFEGEVLPKLKKAYIDKGKVHFIVREFPIGRSAAAAALAARCVSDKDYFKVVDKYLLTQKDWVAQEVKKDEIYNVVKTTGLKRDKFDACLTNQSINDALVLVKTRGRGFGVAGTPTFFVNGKKVAGAVSFEEMQAVIEAELASSSAHPQAGGQPEAKNQQKAVKKPT